MCECNVNVSSLVHDIETHVCLDMSHTRASMIDIINIIHKHTQMHIRHGNYFLLSLPMARDCYMSGRNVFDVRHVINKYQSQPNSHQKCSIIQVSNLLAVPEVCKDIVRSLGRDYRVYSISSKDSNPAGAKIVLAALSNGAA